MHIVSDPNAIETMARQQRPKISNTARNHQKRQMPQMADAIQDLNYCMQTSKQTNATEGRMPNQRNINHTFVNKIFNQYITGSKVI